MSEQTKALAIQENGGSVPDVLRPSDVVAQVALIQEVMRTVMRDDTHYGKIPGCGDKPTLLKAGAEKLLLTFRLSADPDVDVIDLGTGHREYRVRTTIRSIKTGDIMGVGMGSASTMETKYRFRTGPVEFTGEAVPKEYWNLRKTDPVKAAALLGGKGRVTKKNPDTGGWEIAIQGDRVEHDNPADYYNTALKMGVKRSLVNGVLMVTAASDIFSQDVEELIDNGVIEIVPSDNGTPPPPTAPTPEPDPTAKKAEATGKKADPPPVGDIFGNPEGESEEDLEARIMALAVDTLHKPKQTVRAAIATAKKDGANGLRDLLNIFQDVAKERGQ